MSNLYHMNMWNGARDFTHSEQGRRIKGVCLNGNNRTKRDSNRTNRNQRIIRLNQAAARKYILWKIYCRFEIRVSRMLWAHTYDRSRRKKQTGKKERKKRTHTHSKRCEFSKPKMSGERTSNKKKKKIAILYYIYIPYTWNEQRIEQKEQRNGNGQPTARNRKKSNQWREVNGWGNVINTSIFILGITLGGLFVNASQYFIHVYIERTVWI